ncbi:MAG: hypothetical protein AAGG50_04000 [Bacteroidota bacterium]
MRLLLSIATALLLMLPGAGLSAQNFVFDDFAYFEPSIKNGTTNNNHCERVEGSVFGLNDWHIDSSGNNTRDAYGWRASNWGDICFTGNIRYVDINSNNIPDDSTYFWSKMRLELPQGTPGKKFRNTDVVSNFVMGEGTYLYRVRLGNIPKNDEQIIRQALWLDHPNDYRFCDPERGAGSSGTPWCTKVTLSGGNVSGIDVKPNIGEVVTRWWEADYEFSNEIRFHTGPDPVPPQDPSCLSNEDAREHETDRPARLRVGNPFNLVREIDPPDTLRSSDTPQRYLQCIGWDGNTVGLQGQCGDCISNGTGYFDSGDNIFTDNESLGSRERWWNLFIFVFEDRIEYGAYSAESLSIWAGDNALTGSPSWWDTISLSENTPFRDVAAVISTYWLDIPSEPEGQGFGLGDPVALDSDIFLDIEYFYYTEYNNWNSVIQANSSIQSHIQSLRGNNIYRIAEGVDLLNVNTHEVYNEYNLYIDRDFDSYGNIVYDMRTDLRGTLFDSSLEYEVKLSSSPGFYRFKMDEPRIVIPASQIPDIEWIRVTADAHAVWSRKDPSNGYPVSDVYYPNGGSSRTGNGASPGFEVSREYVERHFPGSLMEVRLVSSNEDRVPPGKR